MKKYIEHAKAWRETDKYSRRTMDYDSFEEMRNDSFLMGVKTTLFVLFFIFAGSFILGVFMGLIS